MASVGRIGAGVIAERYIVLVNKKFLLFRLFDFIELNPEVLALHQLFIIQPKIKFITNRLLRVVVFVLLYHLFAKKNVKEPVHFINNNQKMI